MSNLGNHSFGIKFECDDSASSMISGNSVQGHSSQFDAAEAAVAKLSSLLDGQRGGMDGSFLRRTPDAPPSDGVRDMPSNKKKKPLTHERREDRNLREKERSLKITQQIHELRGLLSMGGVIVPKGTKSTILTEAANYIRLLQQQAYHLEIEKAQLVQEVQRIGNGAIGEKAAYAIQHVAAQNGVSYMTNLPESVEPQQPVGSASDQSSENLSDREYRCVFNSCSVGMAIATMGGSFIDCNQAFTQLSSYSKQELRAMTIFNITSREDLQGAFDMMSQLITPPTGVLDADGNSIEVGKVQAPVILRSAIRHRNDLGLSVSLIRGDDGVARNFNVTLVKLPPSTMGLGGLNPVPATAEMSPDIHLGQRPNIVQQTSMPIVSQSEQVCKHNYPGLHAPQYTAG
ncbi:hypothetical protein ACHAXA_006045 [Cyclostephanos tholiformis]|uniref:BHLH domain-containing protein n=1 Tax=Cyclostephanos tholiformis TaxID=382380 RepID=A0ABD3RSN5_9STRA